MMQWYAHQVANHPSLVILFVLTAAGICIIISLTTSELPSFKDPLLGFEPRGTELAQRGTAWKNLQDCSSWLGPLSMFPGQHNNPLVPNGHNFTPQTAALRGGEIEIKVNNDREMENETNLEADPSGRSGTWVVLEPDSARKPWEKLRRTLGQDSSTIVLDRNFFCNDPGRAYAHVILQSTVQKNLLSLDSLKAICGIGEVHLKQSSQYTLLCELNSRKKCCRSWSLPNYIAMLRGRRSCRNITQEDVNAVLETLQFCAEFYHSLKLSHDCTADPALCRGVPRRCTEHNAVYNILHYLTDTDFLSLSENSTKITFSSIFLPIAQSIATMDYFNDLENRNLGDGDIEVAGIQFGLKHALFDQKVIHDSFYVGLAGLIIFVFLWMYTTSFFVTFMTNLAVLFSLAIAYFMYVSVFKITFFPFMNILAVVIATGIGADDAFIYCKIWTCAKAEKNSGTLVKLVRDTLQHACLSMFVTSITTAAAFFGSFTSSITAVRCFSIFAGMSVLANFVFTVTCLPASVIVAEHWCSCTFCSCIPPFGIYLPPFQRFRGCSWLCNSLWKMHYTFTDGARVFFEKILPCMIIKLRCFWLVLFTGLAVGASVAVFYYPKLQLPDTKDFQIFRSDHPFERYELVLKKKFWFEKAREHDSYHTLPIRLVWGVLPVDTGNFLNPFDKGSLVFDDDFDVASPAAQVWLLNFCKQLHNQSFYQPTVGPLLPNCFIQTLKSWMERKCVDGFSNTNRAPCCESSKFPYSREVFSICLRKAIESLHRTPGYYFVSGVAGPRFSTDNDQIKAVVIEYDSTFSYTNSYSEMHDFKTQVDTWVKGMMATAPEGMRNGWFISDLEFYDLQDSLAQGTLVAIGVAIGVSFLALLVTTLNLLISLYAIFTISCIIVVTVASLILLGWKLNVLESITVSVAIGLAVDLTLHYGVAYRLSSQEDRESSVIYSISRIGSPVAMGAFTTFVAGAMMFPSSVLTYLQIGTFLVLVMTISWIYATFFFQSLLSIIGPQNGQLQLQYPSLRFCCCFESTTVTVDKTVYALSESTLSTSSASYPTQLPANEIHELEPLTTVKSLRNEMLKCSKKKPRSTRQRSGSFSVALSRKHDTNVAQCSANVSRKVSLPTVSVTFHGEPSSQYEDLEGNSSLTIAGVEEEKESLTMAQKTEPKIVSRDSENI